MYGFKEERCSLRPQSIREEVSHRETAVAEPADGRSQLTAVPPRRSEKTASFFEVKLNRFYLQSTLEKRNEPTSGCTDITHL